MARLHGVNVEESPPPGCILTAPGLGGGDAVTVTENSRDALVEEAETFLDELDFAAPSREDSEEQDVVVQTLNGPRRTDPKNPPRRIVVRRERRTTRRGNDPPSD